MVWAQCEKLHYQAPRQRKKKNTNYDLSGLLKTTPCTELNYSRMQRSHLTVLTDCV